MNLNLLFGGAVMALGVLGAASANAVTFATYNPVDGGAANIALTGLALSASAPVVFNYLDPTLSPLGDLAASLSLNATETGATSFGPLALATFDGSFNLAYTGPTKTVGALTVTTGESLLSGTFLGSVFSGYGSAGNIIDSNLGGGLVSYNNSSLITFDPTADEGLSVGLTSITPIAIVTAGQLANFTAVSQGEFAANFTVNGGGGGVPEPATWAVMLAGFGGLGMALRSRRSKVAAAALPATL
jgi:hypothetical protein